MAPVLDVPLLPLPPPFMLVPVSVPLELGLLVPPAGVLVAPAPPALDESSMLLVWLVADSLPCTLLVLDSLPPQLLSTRPPSSRVARGKREMERCIEIESKG